MKIILLALLFVSELSFAYSVKCTQEQDICEVDTKRLVPGDKIGIFSDDGYLIAIGVIEGLKDTGARKVKITRRYGRIKKTHDLILIKDDEAQSPLKYFKVAKPESEHRAGGGLAIHSIGVGEGFLAYGLEGLYEYKWKTIAWVGRGIFFTGSGNASINELEIENVGVSMQVFGALGGASYTFFPNAPISFRTEATLGFANVSVSTDSEYDVQDVVDGRVGKGMGLIGNLEGDVLFAVGDMRAYAGAHYFRLQGSNNAGISGGLIFNL
ncbi:MAG: hypothetical protein AB7T49_20535 [Oligoflexales bacterium]